MLKFKYERPFRQLKPYHGILVFVLEIIAFLSIMVPLQMKFGMYGVALTELLLLLIAVGYTLLLKADFKKVFPIKRIQTSELFGTFVLWLCTFIMVLVLTLIIAYFFPKEIFGVSSGLTDVISSVPFGMSLLISVIMPAVCEEALHRGVILHSMLPINRKWMIVVCMGIIFGIFHMDPWRFVPTAILGGTLSYVMLETGNIIYPMLLHGINNFVPLIISFATGNYIDETGMGESFAQTGVPLAS